MQPVVLDFAGTKIAARCGETVAAALTRAGIRALRRGPDGAERGIFCGMGVCQDCVVAIDGVPGRACMTAVTGPHRIAPGGVTGPTPPAAPLPPIELADIQVLTPDVLVVGGGGAGLAAAVAAAEAGASVVLLDERSRPGGQYFKQPAPDLKTGDDRRFAAGRRLLARAQGAGVRLLSEATVWAAVPPRDIAVLTSSGLALYRPAALVVATGAYERARPVPGWTLPGVMTTGAAQTLLRGEGVAPGRRVLVCGHGPLNLQVAVELARNGVQVVAVAEQAARPGPRHAGALLRMAASAPALLAQGVALRRELRRRRVPVLHGHVLAAVRAVPDGLQAELAGLPAAFEVDVVCMGYGFQPANEILLALDCRHRFDPVRAQLVTERDGDGGTSVAGVYAAGDCCGLGGAQAAVADGRIAGAAAARHAGRTAPRETAARRRLARHRRFQDGLWHLYAAPDMTTALATPDTVVCRCEGVTMGTIQAAIDAGAPGIGAVKRLTRAGMGACQGRYCAPVLAALLARRSGAPIDALSFLAPRAPIKPVPITALSRPQP